MQNNDIKLPQEEQISQLIDNAASRIEQYQAALKKEYNRGPELRLDPPDKWNSPDGPFARIEQLNRSIESLKLNAIKRTYEIAEDLPKERQQAAINLAFDRLAPEINAKEYKQERADLTDKFREASNEISGNGKVPFHSRFLDVRITEQNKSDAEKQVEAVDNHEEAGRMNFQSRFMAAEKPQPFVSRFIDMPVVKPDDERTQQKEKRQPDFTPEK